MKLHTVNESEASFTRWENRKRWGRGRRVWRSKL